MPLHLKDYHVNQVRSVRNLYQRIFLDLLDQLFIVAQTIGIDISH